MLPDSKKRREHGEEGTGVFHGYMQTVQNRIQRLGQGMPQLRRTDHRREDTANRQSTPGLRMFIDAPCNRPDYLRTASWKLLIDIK